MLGGGALRPDQVRAVLLVHVSQVQDRLEQAIVSGDVFFWRVCRFFQPVFLNDQVIRWRQIFLNGRRLLDFRFVIFPCFDFFFWKIVCRVLDGDRLRF